MTRTRELLRRALVPLLAIITALLVGAIVIVLTDFENLSRLGTDPLGAIGGAFGGVVGAYGSLLAGAFGDPARIVAAFETGNPKDIATAIRPLTESLVAATPLILTGLAVAVSFRAGMFNIGIDGQLMIGALGATITAFALQGQVPGFAILLLSITVGVLAGGFWGFIPGFLKARTGAHEVITTIMLTYIASQIIFFALRSPILRAPGSTAPVSKPMSNFVDIPLLINLPAIRLDFGFLIALLMAGVVSFLLFRTTKGFELRASGFNMTAARYAGMSAGGSMMLAMAISGGLAGLAGSFLVIGTVGQLSLDLSGGVGYTAIALALLAGLRPLGVVLAALLFGALTSGGLTMGIQSGISAELLGFIMALVILFVAAPNLIRSMWRIKVVDPAKEAVAPHQPTSAV
ncbi:MAG TPA: ABC transporter permease [Candidatus Limnocylindrales bacterium]